MFLENSFGSVWILTEVFEEFQLEKADGFEALQVSRCFSDKILTGELWQNSERGNFLFMVFFNFSDQNYAREADSNGILPVGSPLTKASEFTYLIVWF